jgi:transcription termination/antitermination protein NusG
MARLDGREPRDDEDGHASQDLITGGGALQPNAEPEVEHAAGGGERNATPTHQTCPRWYALYTRSHCEQLVYEQLVARGFSVFLPKLDVWSRRGGIRHRISLPMFPSYLFLHHLMDKIGFIEVSKARGLVRILGERWDRLSVVPESEIDAIQRVLRAELPVSPHPYLREGQQVRITHGPLAGVEGILIQSKPNKGLLVLSIELLRRSIAVEVDATAVGVA